ncbi:MAG: hypothetical protein FWG90_08090 [Oscillospiraceae bacterium]|nr:hypothetical protein [Oscillospiraceae bacterium]
MKSIKILPTIVLLCVNLFLPSEAENNQKLNNMPEIVFIATYNHDMNRSENITGHYLTNQGEVKFFNFMIENPLEYYRISDVYHRLEEATYEDYYGLDFIDYRAKHSVADIPDVPLDKLEELYSMLLLVDRENRATVISREILPDVQSSGTYQYHGLRYDEENEVEIIFIWSWNDGPHDVEIPDPYADKLYNQLRFERFLPPIPMYMPYDDSAFWQS